MNASWLWGLAGRSSINVRLWLYDAAVPPFTQVVCVYYTCLVWWWWWWWWCSCILPNRNKI